jgi:hypothetical protein
MSEKEYSIDIKEIPDDAFQAICYLDIKASEANNELSLEFINQLPEIVDFKNAYKFVMEVLSDGCKGDTTSISSIGLIPVSQAENEYASSIELMFSSFYRQSYDSLRRFIEFSLLQIYFTFDDSNRDLAIKWFRSQMDTPFFNHITKLLLKNEQIFYAENEISIITDLRNLYWNLCDKTHIKGFIHSDFSDKTNSFSFNNIKIRSLNKDYIKENIELNIQSVSIIACIYSIYNPVLLHSLPIYEKFGMNPPAFGFFNDYQSKLLWKVINSKYHEFLKKISNTSTEVKDLVNWINNLPNMTDKDFELQDIQFEELLNSFKRKT